MFGVAKRQHNQLNNSLHVFGADCFFFLFIITLLGHSAIWQMDQIQLPVELQPELYLLICRFLDKGPCQEAADLIRRQLDRHELLPRRVDWLGNQHVTSWRVFEERHLHITHEFLPRVLARVSTLLNKQIPASGFTSSSLLGAGSQSLLRFSSGMCFFFLLTQFSFNLNRN